ncbi:ribosomal protein L7/L12 [Dactylosporangium sp. NPDC051485]|uniref:ribosomal protein L7/L12 n=1 Tax=Dactylosporangium sp. NPDC051485 TaxID=3154846 RepID=UPI00343991AD
MYADDASRLARLERQVAFLYRHFGLDPQLADAFPGTDSMPPEFTQALRANNLIAAIKIYREVTGCGLVEAKAAVERIARSV